VEIVALAHSGLVKWRQDPLC